MVGKMTLIIVKQVSGKMRILNLNLRSYEIACVTQFAIFFRKLV